MSERMAVRLAQAEDDAAIGGLIHALDAHYRGALAPSAARAAAMARRTIEAREGTHFALGLLDGVPQGLAAFAILRPGRDGKGVLFAKEILCAPRRAAKGWARPCSLFCRRKRRVLALAGSNSPPIPAMRARNASTSGLAASGWRKSPTGSGCRRPQWNLRRKWA